MNLATLLERSAADRPDHPALVFGDRHWSNAETERRQERFGLPIAECKVPKQVEFVDTLPTSPTGKVLKRELRG